MAATDDRRPLEAAGARTGDEDVHDEDRSGTGWRPYLRFGAMILTAVVVMYGVMYAGSWELGHVRFSESRVFMALTMGGTMGIAMLAFMRDMYRSMRGNVAVVAVSVVLVGGGILLDRSQATVDDVSFMRAMISHHSLAITRSERFQNDDVRVCARD